MQLFEISLLYPCLERLLMDIYRRYCCHPLCLYQNTVQILDKVFVGVVVKGKKTETHCQFSPKTNSSHTSSKVPSLYCMKSCWFWQQTDTKVSFVFSLPDIKSFEKLFALDFHPFNYAKKTWAKKSCYRQESISAPVKSYLWCNLRIIAILFHWYWCKLVLTWVYWIWDFKIPDF